MRRLILHWLLNTLSLVVAARVVPGIHITGFGAALVAVVVIGFINATLGLVLKIVTFPLTLLTLGLFLLVINAVVLELAAVVAPGFEVDGFPAAFLGALVLTIVNIVLRRLVFRR